MKAATYLRVSTDEQSYENQRPEVEALAATRGLELVSSYEEQASAVKARPAFSRMMADAHRGRFQVLVVWSLDRLGRSMVGNLQTVLELDACGVRVLSVREPWLDTQGPVRSLLLAIFSWVAEQERAQLVARTKAGIARARSKGIHIGRPFRPVNVERARELLAQGKTQRQIAMALKVPRTSLRRALKGVEQ